MDLFVPNSSGKRIAVSMHSPKGEDVHSLAVLLPGFLDSKDYLHLISLGEELAKLGFTAVRVDPTGTWESEGKISEYSVSQYLKDVASVIAFMKKKSEFVQIVLVGHSMGGMIALLYAAAENNVDAVVGMMFPTAIAKFSQWQEKLEEWKKSSYKVSYREIPDNLSKQREYKVPYSFVEDVKAYDVLKVIDNLRMPLLLIAAESDEGIPVGEVREVFKRAHEPKKFGIIRKAEHRYWNKQNHLREVNNQILRFLEEYSLV